jgi:prolyl-tRNA synthetase
MRVSELMIPTLRETPAEAEIISHQLLLKAGYIRKVAAGVYTLLPLAWRVVRKIEQIVREEMDRQGGLDFMMPIIQPAELWQESGRWDVYGPELFRLKDRHDRDFCLGPTHEEIITTLVKGEVNSYKQLPLLLYQIQNKYRDERRPRFGLMRSREFIMKDLYSFDRDDSGLDISYDKMYEAYTKIFTRCGLLFRPVVADSGAIGGSDTHEFMVLAESGEATVVYCQLGECGYAANVERAESVLITEPLAEKPLPLGEVATPGRRTIAEVAEYLHVKPEATLKTLIYETEHHVVAAVVRGDREVNEVKLYNALPCVRLELASEATVRRITGNAPGFVGPVGLNDVLLVVDEEAMVAVNTVVGANRNDLHLINVNPGRDFTPAVVADIRTVRAGQPCPKCGAALNEAKGIEVGQVFKLGDKYSKALNCTYLDDSGKSRFMIMGCYGIGITRTMAAAIEQNHDAEGIIWPVSIAPYHVVVVPVSSKDSAQMELALDIYRQLSGTGLEVVLDDRPDRAGVKFKDADLVGYPVRITVGARGVADRTVELRSRRSGETVVVPLQQLINQVMDMLKA